MESALKSHPLLDTTIPSVYLKSNTDIVIEFVNYSGLKTFLNCLDKQFKFFETTVKTVADIIELINDINNIRRDIEQGNLSQVSLKRAKKDLSIFLLRVYQTV